MSKVKITLDTKKIEKELNKQLQKIKVRETIKREMDDQLEVNRVKLLDSMTEEAFKLIFDQYDGNSSNCVSGEYGLFPEYMKFSIGDIFEKLKIDNLVASVIQSLSGWSIYLTPNGKTYFEDKELIEMKNISEFNKLTNGTRLLLQELLNANNTSELLQAMFEKASEKEVNRLRGMLKELKGNDMISIVWGSGIPTECILNYKAYEYFEREKEYGDQMQKNKSTNIHIGTFNANGSNVVFGDAVNSTFSIDNSVKNIEEKIESQGGEDKEILMQLLNEAKEIVENIGLTRQIPKNKGFINRLSSHLDKHGWFYAEIISLLGTAAISLMIN